MDKFKKDTLRKPLIQLSIKPLSVNVAWQGKRFKSKEYKQYEEVVMLMLPKVNLPPKPYRFNIWYGFSSKSADIDNPTKPIIDIMQKKYGFNDKDIFVLHIEKEIVKKGSEYIRIEILSI